MDEMDHIQDAAVAAQEKILADRRRRLEHEAGIVPPLHRLCDDCGGEIPAARLRLRPLTRLCVDCQADAERPRQ
jgi:phage/conjugal plasmid C-4 type zinc finger TraR family protein